MIGDAETVARGLVQGRKPCHYHIDQTGVAPLPTGHTSNRCGAAITRWDGSVELGRDPRAA